MAAPDDCAVVHATSMGNTQSALQSMALSCNRDGMECLAKGQHQAAFEKLKYAEVMLTTNQKDETNTSLLAVTCNNLGCYYKKMEKVNPALPNSLTKALNYLRRALAIEVSLQVSDMTVSGTHLNICAILSNIGKHDKALQHALCALELVRNHTTASGGSTLDDYSLVAIAYHNVAAEQAFLRHWEDAANTSREGLEVVRRWLPVGHPLAKELEKSCNAAELQRLKASQRKSPKQPLTPKRSSSRGVRGGQVLHDGRHLPAISGETQRPRTSPMSLSHSPISQQQAEWMM